MLWALPIFKDRLSNFDWAISSSIISIFVFAVESTIVNPTISFLKFIWSSVSFVQKSFIRSKSSLGALTNQASGETNHELKDPATTPPSVAPAKYPTAGLPIQKPILLPTVPPHLTPLQAPPKSATITATVCLKFHFVLLVSTGNFDNSSVFTFSKSFTTLIFVSLEVWYPKLLSFEHEAITAITTNKANFNFNNELFIR